MLTETTRTRTWPGQTLLVLFLLSGGCALIYEIVWTRLFTVIIGNTVFSVSGILSVFMAGLALGSRLAGRFVDRRPIRLARAYALLEAGIGIFNLFLPFLLKVADPVFAMLYQSAHQSVFLLGLARFAITFALLIIPATLIGATLPILIRFYADTIENAGSQAGRVYAINTLGAALGAAAAGFVLVPYGGTMFALYFAAVVNLGIAVVAWRLGKQEESVFRVSSEGEQARGPRILVAAMFCSGFAALLDEVAWTRVLALIAGPTTYAFTIMLCSMIAGLAIGAAIGSLWVRRRGTQLRTFAWVQIGVGWTSLALIPAFGRMPLWIASLVRRYSESITTLESIEFLAFFGVMLAPTIFLGMTFPIASRLYATSDALLGSEVSAIYAANTAGGIIGSFVAGFVLIPRIGSQSTLILAGLLSTTIAVLVTAARGGKLPALCWLLAVTAVFFVPAWNPEWMSSGAYKYAPQYPSTSDLESMLAGGDLLYFKEGAATTVSVRKYRGNTMLSVDGKVDATDAGDMTTQKLLAHLPLLLSKDPKNVALVGLGSGVTAASALRYPIEKLDVIEISPEVVEASDFFSHVNQRALADPRNEVIVGDGRNHLRYTNRRYDVIISEPSNPWMSGMASLFTREFFEESLSRLTEGGIHCQWFHSYNMSLDDLRTVVATFRAVFPHGMLWSLTEYDLLLLGSRSPLSFDQAVFERNFERVRGDLAEIKIQDPYSIMSSLMLRDAELDHFSQGAALNTDNFPILEFRAPLSIYTDTTDRNLAALSSAVRIAEPTPYMNKVLNAVTSEGHRHKAEALLAAEAFNGAMKEFRAAIALNENDAKAWKGLVESSRGVNRAELQSFLEAQLQAHPLTIVRLSAADFYSSQGQFEKTVDLLDEVLATEPNNLEALEKLADALAEQGSARLTEATDRLLKIAPENPVGLYHVATIRLYQSRFDEAIQTAKLSLERDSKSARAGNLLAIAYERTFQPDLAEAEFRRIISQSPDDWVSFNNYGIFLLGRNRADDALQQFQQAVSLNSENARGIEGMNEARRQGGKNRKAEKWYRQVTRALFPSSWPAQLKNEK